MRLLDKVEKGFIEKPSIMVTYGINGIGKTYWASKFQMPFFIDTEDGSSHLNVARIGKNAIDSYDMVLLLLDELTHQDHPYKTIVLDSLESIESLIHRKVCADNNATTIENLGYGKGYAIAKDIGVQLMHKLQALRDKRGVTIIIIGHAQIKSHTDPNTNATFDRFTMRVNDKLGAVVRDLADHVFFASFRYYTKKEGNKTQAFGEGERVLYTQWRPAFDAKCRLDLPFELPLDYEAFKAALEACKPRTPEELLVDIAEAMKGIPEEEIKAKITEAVEKAKDDTKILNAILERVRLKIENS